MFKNSEVNLNYLYTDANINTFVSSVINYTLGGFKYDQGGNPFTFLLKEKFGEGNNIYYVAYSGAIDSAQKTPLDWFFDKSKQSAPDIGRRDDRRDIWDELIPIMVSEKSCKVKIVFPYNITDIHWLTGEIFISKEVDDVYIKVYTHDPYGAGCLSESNFTLLKNILEKRILESDLNLISVTQEQSPYERARQHQDDSTSCGVIVADEIIKIINGSTLNRSSPHSIGAKELRLSQLNFLHDKLGEGDGAYQSFKQHVTQNITFLPSYLSYPLDKPENTTKMNEVGNSTESITDLTFSKKTFDHDSNINIQQIKNNLKKAQESVQQKLQSTDDNQVKITFLKKIEETEYADLIRQLAYRSIDTLEALENLTQLLSDLGYLTTKLGELSGELKYYTDAAVFYRYVISILDQKLDNNSITSEDKQNIIDPYKALNRLQQLIFSGIGIDTENGLTVQEEANINKQFLSEQREKTIAKLKEVESYRQKANTADQEGKGKYQELYINTSRELFKETTGCMKKLLAKLYVDSETQINIAPPCKYAVIGLGSMALEQMTPYSDLEFAILIDNEGENKTEGDKIKQYFKNLTYLVSFKIINLGETIIPTSKYDVDMSHLVPRGVNLDLGGKTPLGRIGGDKPYKLIKIIDRMIHYVHNKDDKASNIDKNLPYILEQVCHVHGDNKLVDIYRAKVTEFLTDSSAGRPNCEVRALKILKEGVVERDYLQKREDNPHKGDLDKLKPEDLLLQNVGRLFDVKQAIYRLPDRLVYNFGLYYGIQGDSAWDTVDKLRDQAIITPQAALNLKSAITFATTLRLQTYSYNKAQKEDMSIFARLAETEGELNEQITQIFYLSKEDLGEHGGLFQYFYTAAPFHAKLEAFCMENNEDKKKFFHSTSFYENNSVIRGFIHYRLGQYAEA